MPKREKKERQREEKREPEIEAKETDLFLPNPELAKSPGVQIISNTVVKPPTRTFHIIARDGRIWRPERIKYNFDSMLSYERGILDDPEDYFTFVPSGCGMLKFKGMKLESWRSNDEYHSFYDVYEMYVLADGSYFLTHEYWKKRMKECDNELIHSECQKADTIPELLKYSRGKLWPEKIEIPMLVVNILHRIGVDSDITVWV